MEVKPNRIASDSVKTALSGKVQARHFAYSRRKMREEEVI